MKITIDTKEDSHDEIRRIIKMLSSLVGQEEVMSNQGDLFSDDSSLGVDTTEPESTPSTSPSSDMFSDESPKSEGEGMFNMFSASSTPASSEDSSASSEETTEDTSEDTQGTTEETDDDITKDIPDVEEYS